MEASGPRKRAGAGVLPLLGLGALMATVGILVLFLNGLTLIVRLFIFNLAAFFFALVVVLLLRPEAMGSPPWAHRFRLSHHELPGSEDLRRVLGGADGGGLPIQRAMLLLEERRLLLELLSLRSSGRGPPPGDPLSLPSVVALLRGRPPLRRFLEATEGLARDPEAWVEGWTDMEPPLFAERLADLTQEILGAFA